MKVSFSPKQRGAADVHDGIKVPYAPGRRNVFQWRWYLILCLVTSPFFYLLFKIFWPYVVLSAPGYLSLQKSIVTVSVSGTVRQVVVRDGDTVAEGQPLVRVAAPELEQRIERLEEQRDTPAMPPPAPPAPAGPQRQIASGGARLALYRQAADHARQAEQFQQQRLKTIQHLFEQGAATAAEVNAVRAQRDMARHTRVQALLDLANVQAEVPSVPPPSRPETPPGQNRQSLTEQLRRLEAELEPYTPRAPAAGTILEITATAGKRVNGGDYLALIGRGDQVQVISYVRPESAANITKGRKATVRLPGGPSLQAEVHEPPTQARRLPADLSSVIGTRDVMVIVTLDITEPFPAERAIENLPVEVRFHRFW